TTEIEIEPATGFARADNLAFDELVATLAFGQGSRIASVAHAVIGIGPDAKPVRARGRLGRDQFIKAAPPLRQRHDAGKTLGDHLLVDPGAIWRIEEDLRLHVAVA